jgi:hypothetical protein
MVHCGIEHPANVGVTARMTKPYVIADRPGLIRRLEALHAKAPSVAENWPRAPDRLRLGRLPPGGARNSPTGVIFGFGQLGEGYRCQRDEDCSSSSINLGDTREIALGPPNISRQASCTLAKWPHGSR